MLVLSAGAVEDAPAEVDVQVNTFVEPSRTVPIVWTAPELQLDIEGGDGSIATNDIEPDPTGPPVLETPLCTAP